ncbi:hypothetical protein WS61_02895 [Burkholderia sp. ABCPW 11]|nr:hypothetical protein WS61_02895 [Burkholderia sp. ABCPW 11]
MSFAFHARVDVRRFVRDGWLHPPKPPHRDVLVEVAHRQLHDRAVVVRRDDRVVAVAGDLGTAFAITSSLVNGCENRKCIERATTGSVISMDFRRAGAACVTNAATSPRATAPACSTKRAALSSMAWLPSGRQAAVRASANGHVDLGEDAASRAGCRSYGDCGASRSTVRSAVSNGVA